MRFGDVLWFQIWVKDLNTLVYKIWDLTLRFVFRFAHHWFFLLSELLTELSEFSAGLKGGKNVSISLWSPVPSPGEGELTDLEKNTTKQPYQISVIWFQMKIPVHRKVAQLRWGSLIQLLTCYATNEITGYQIEDRRDVIEKVNLIHWKYM